jgi:hypothetical protein
MAVESDQVSFQLLRLALQSAFVTLTWYLDGIPLNSSRPATSLADDKNDCVFKPKLHPVLLSKR